MSRHQSLAKASKERERKTQRNTEDSLASDTPNLEGVGGIELPKEWRWERLGNLFEIQQGKALNSKNQSDGETRPFLRTSNVFWGRLDLSELDEMGFTESEQDRLALRQGDLLSCEGGDVGRTAMWRGETTPCFYQNHIHRLRTTRPDVEPEFFMRWMETAMQQLGLYGGTSNKTTIPNLSKNRLASFVVPKPPIEEQRSIASILRTVQGTKEACERVIAATRQLKQSLLHHLFTYGPVPFDQADKVPLKETEMGPMPQTWNIGRVGDFATLAQYGLSYRGGTTGRYPILRMNNLQDGNVLTEQVKGGLQYVDLDDVTLAKFRLQPGELLFNRTNSSELVGKTSLFELSGDFIFASYLIRLQLDNRRLDPRFANYYLNMSATQARMKQLASRGVSQSNINATKLKGFEVPIPSVSEQRDIAAQLATVDAKLAAAEARRNALDNLFKSLLHHLMTGKVRVNTDAAGVVG